ncbi:MAG: glutaminyl-peptide cyclotransferase [Cyclobacteriaceae bacterium]
MSKTSIALLALILFACGGETEKSERPTSPRIRKETKIVEPKTNQKFVSGEQIKFQVTSDSRIDSVSIELDGKATNFTDSIFEYTVSSRKVGSKRIKTTVYFSGKKETHYTKTIFLPNIAPEEYTYQVINTYPHDKSDYTQGLLIADGFLYESTGQRGSSTLEKKEIESGKTLEQVNLSDDFFGEGLALINDKLYQLTYTSGACLVYNKGLEQVNSFNYQGEGWGLCEFDGRLLMTNSTEKITIRDPATFSSIDELEVYDNSGKIDSINELEVIDGLIYANVYQEDFIVVIDPETGAVLQKIDMSNLLSAGERDGIDVLNGIAYDREKDRIFVTGKLWPKLFEVKFLPKNPL